jgi:hypothetical protein
MMGRAMDFASNFVLKIEAKNRPKHKKEILRHLAYLFS